MQYAMTMACEVASLVPRGGTEVAWRGDDVVNCQSSSSDVLDSSVDDNRCASCGSSLATCVDGDLHARVSGRRP